MFGRPKFYHCPTPVLPPQALCCIKFCFWHTLKRDKTTLKLVPPPCNKKLPAC